MPLAGHKLDGRVRQNIMMLFKIFYDVSFGFWSYKSRLAGV